MTKAPISQFQPSSCLELCYVFLTLPEACQLSLKVNRANGNPPLTGCPSAIHFICQWSGYTCKCCPHLSYLMLLEFSGTKVLLSQAVAMLLVRASHFDPRVGRMTSCSAPKDPKGVRANPLDVHFQAAGMLAPLATRHRSMRTISQQAVKSSALCQLPSMCLKTHKRA